MTAHSMPIGGIDLASTFGTLASLTGDPTVRLRQGIFERATVTPDGSSTIAVSWHTDEPDARVEAHGDGADWLLEPYRPHRYRVIRLAFASGIKPPRRHHRARRIDIRQR